MATLPFFKKSARQTIADVIGEPETWQNWSIKRDGETADMRRAWISEIDIYDHGITIATLGGMDGPTYNVFTVEDPDMRERLLRVLEVGQGVDVAAALEIS